jgi:DNA-directed RNA polymerase specialized sigma subunit
VSLFEFWGDKSQYAAWLQGEFAEEADFHTHTLNALRVAMEEELTDKQREYIEMFFVYGMSMKDIGQELGVSKATVSRTINCGLDRLYHVLRYANPRYLTFPKIRTAASLKKGRKQREKGS